MNVSSVKNLNGEVFSAVQDASLTNVVQTNSGNWQDIIAYQNNSASYQPSGNYIPYTAVDNSNTAFKTNSGLSIVKFGEGGLYSTLLSPNTIQMYFVDSPTLYYGAILSDTSLKFETYSDSAYLDKEKIHTWDSASYYIQNISADEWNNCYNNVNTNSGAWGGSALPISAGKGVGIGVVNDTLVVSSTITGYVWTSASLFTTATPTKNTSYTLSDNCSNYDKLEVDFYDVNNWRTQMDCPIPPNLDASGTRGGYFSVVPASTATGANIWFKAFNWTAAQNTWTCYCSEIAAQGGSTTQTVNANQPDNPPKVVNIIGWKRVLV